VVTGLQEFDSSFGDAIDDAMFQGETPGPTAGKGVPQGLRFAGTRKRVPAHGFDQIKEAEGGFAIGFDPIPQIG
jgi:hypothetical protein